MSALPTTAFAVIVALQVDVHSATNCPSSEDVSARLASLLPSADAGRTRDGDGASVQLVAVRQDGSADLRIELTSATGVRVGERLVSSRGTCAQMAEVVAAVLAAWESDPPPLPVDSLALAQVPTAGAGRAGVAEASSVQADHRDNHRGDYRGSFGVGGGVALLGGVAGALKLAAEAGAGASPWYLAIEASTQSSRTLVLAGGQADWRHSTAGLGMGWRRLGAKVAVSVDAGPTLGWARLAGRGYANGNETHDSFEYGLSGGLRLGRPWRRWQLWAEVRPRWWLKGQRARVGNRPSSSAEVPALELMAYVGASVVAFP